MTAIDWKNKELTKEQQKIYDELMKVIMFEDAKNVLTAWNKIHAQYLREHEGPVYRGTNVGAHKT